MNIIDFIIGAALMNAMPHFVLGIWKGRMLSAFGFGDFKNILYGLLNFVLAAALFVYKYGFSALLENGIFTGALTLLVIYLLTAQFWYSIFHKRYYEKNQRA